MATAVEVRWNEMLAELSPLGFVEVQVPGTKERVLSRIVEKGICQRVLTSIVGDTSRGVGDDAIRVVLVTKADGEVKMIGCDKRVHRVAGWRSNLQERLSGWRGQLGPACPDCGSPTVLKKTARPFWGCCRYPVCKTYQDATPKAAPAPRPVSRPAPRPAADLDNPEWRSRLKEKAEFAALERDAEARAYMAEMDEELAALSVIDSDDPPAEWR